MTTNYFDRFRPKDSDFSPPIRRTYRPYDPAKDPGLGGSGLAIAGATDYADQRRRATIALDQYGYALTPEEQEELEPQGGKGFLDGLFDLLEAPLNTIKLPWILDQAEEGAPASEILGAIWTSDDERLLRYLPHLEGEEGEANLSSAALLRGSGKSPEGFGATAGYATSGIAADILLDPWSWISFGTLGLGRQLAQQGLRAGLKSAAHEATEALVKRGSHELTDSLSVRVAGKIRESAEEVTERVVERVRKNIGLDDFDETQLRRGVEDEVFRFERDNALTLTGGQRLADAAGPKLRERWGDEIASIIDDELRVGDSVIREYYESATSLVADKQFKTLAKDYPEIISSSFVPVYSTGGVTVTTPFFRQRSGGVKLGWRTDREVTAPVRAAAKAAFDRLPENSRVRKAVQALWSRRGADVADRKAASAGKAWRLDFALGAKQAAQDALGVSDSPSRISQTLRAIRSAAEENGDDIDETMRIFGSVLDGETRIADLKANNYLHPNTLDTMEDVVAEARATLNTIHKALAEFDPEMGYIDDYFPLMASEEMGDILQSLSADARAIPVRRIERAAEELAAAGKEQEAANLMVGAQVLTMWSSTTRSLKAAGDGRIVIDHTRFMNSRLVGKTVFTSWADEGDLLMNRAKLVEKLGQHADTNQVGWSSRTALNDAVLDALRWMEEDGTLKLPKNLQPFSMDIPAVLDSYVKATERVINFKAFVQAAEQVNLVRAADEVTEVGLTLANMLGRFDGDTWEVLRSFLKFIDEKRGKGPLAGTTTTIRLGNRAVELDKAIAEIPRVKEKIDIFNDALLKARKNAAAARHAADSSVQRLVKQYDLPEELAQEFAAIDSAAEVRGLVTALWSEHQKRMSTLRAAISELEVDRSLDNVQAAKRELRRAEREWERGISDAIADLTDEWNSSVGFTRYAPDTAVSLDDVVEGGQTRGAVLADMLQKMLRDRFQAEIDNLDEFARAEILEAAEEGLGVDGLLNAVRKLVEDRKVDTGQAAAFKAFSEVRNMVEVSDLQFADIIEELGPQETYRLVMALGGHSMAPIKNDEMFRLVDDMAEALGGSAYAPRLVSGPNGVGDTGAIGAMYMNGPTVNPDTLRGFKGLAGELENQVRYLEDAGFEFRMAAGPVYADLDDFERGVRSKTVWVEPVSGPVPEALQDVTVRLGNDVELPLVPVLETLHRMLGQLPHGHRDDLVGVANSWLAHMQLLPADRSVSSEEIRMAFTQLTRARKTAVLDHARRFDQAEAIPYVMDYPDPRLATPWTAPPAASVKGEAPIVKMHGAGVDTTTGTTTEDVLSSADTGYLGSTKDVTDKSLREVIRDEQIEGGYPGELYGADKTLAEENAAIIEQELKDDRRKFSIQWRKQGMDRLASLSRQIEKDYDREIASRARLPVHVWEEGEAGVVVRLANGDHKVFGSMDEARQWWADDVGRLRRGELRPGGKPGPQSSASFEPDPTNASIADWMAEARRERELRRSGGEHAPQPGGEEFFDEAFDYDSDFESLIDEAFEKSGGARLPEGVEGPELPLADDVFEGVLDRERMGRHLQPTAEGRQAPFNFDEFDDRATELRGSGVYGPESLNPPWEDAEIRKFLPEVEEVPEGAIVARLDDGTIEVFPNARKIWDDSNRRIQYINNAKRGAMRKVDDFLKKLSDEGISLKGLLDDPPPGLREAGLQHPLFTDQAWEGILRAHYKKASHIKSRAKATVGPTLDEVAAEQAARKRASWRTAAEELADGEGLESLVDIVDGQRFLTPGAGVLEALRAGDGQVIANQEVALRRLIETAGMDPDRLIVDRMGDGNIALKWGKQKEYVSVDIRQVAPRLRKLLEENGVDARTMSPREMFAQVRERGLSSPDLAPLLDDATLGGTLPARLEQYFNMTELLANVKYSARLGKRELMGEEASRGLEAILQELEPFVRSRGAVGNTDKLRDVWEANRKAVAKGLTGKDYIELETLVAQADGLRAFDNRLRHAASTFDVDSKMYADAREAIEAIHRVGGDAFQEASDYVRNVYRDVIESVDFFSGTLVDLMSYGRPWRGKLESFQGFEPGYVQAFLDGADEELFTTKVEELIEASKQVRNQMRRILRGQGELSEEQGELVDFMARELHDILPSEGNFIEWIESRMKQLSNPTRSRGRERVFANLTEGFVDQSEFGLAAKELNEKIVDMNVGLLMESMASHTAAMWTPLGVKLLRDQMGAFERYWKAATTVARPTFVLRNMMGGVFNGMIGDVGAREYKWVSTAALRVRNALDRGLSFDQALADLPDDMADVFRAARREGIFDMEFTSDLNLQQLGRERSIKPWKPNFVLFDLGGRFMQRSEDFLRMAAFKRWYDPAQAGSSGLAREIVNATHFDYGNLTQFETKIKKVVPFYVWTRRNIPLQLRTLFERPGIAMRYRHLQQNVEASFYDENDPSHGTPMPGWMGSQAASLFTMLHGMGQEGEGGAPDFTRFIFSPDLPFKDFEQLVDALVDHENGSFIGALEWAGNSVTPIVKIPFDAIKNAQYDTTVPAPLGMAQALQVLDSLVGVPGAGVNAETGDFEVPYWMRSLYEGLVPFQREILETGGIFQDDPRRAQRLGVADPDDVSAGERAIASALSIARAFGVRGATEGDLVQETIRLDQTVQSIIDEAEREGRILKSPSGERLGREDLAKIVGDPFEGAPQRHTPANIRVIDGDTFEIDGKTIRLGFANTAELGDVTADDAAEYLRNALSQGADIRIEETGFGQHGRTIAEVWVNGVNLANALIGAGHASYIPSTHDLYQPVRVDR